MAASESLSANCQYVVIVPMQAPANDELISMGLLAKRKHKPGGISKLLCISVKADNAADHQYYAKQNTFHASPPPTLNCSPALFEDTYAKLSRPVRAARMAVNPSGTATGLLDQQLRRKPALSPTELSCHQLSRGNSPGRNCYPSTVDRSLDRGLSARNKQQSGTYWGSRD